ncbi:MAG: Uma2 family endonuclease [Chloroflexota bacterium]
MSMRAPNWITTRQYLLFEQAARVKHEYRGGHVFPLGDPYTPVDTAVVIGQRPEPFVAMAGASDTHVTIVQNLVVLIRPHLGAGPCRLYSTDMRVETATGDYLYPDLVVTCDERDLQDPLMKRNPALIIEVLSPSTEGYDRGEKFDAFAATPSLMEYVLVSTRDQRVEIWIRREGRWERTTYLPPATVPFTTINLHASFETLYLGVQWGPRLLSTDKGDETEP